MRWISSSNAAFAFGLVTMGYTAQASFAGTVSGLIAQPAVQDTTTTAITSVVPSGPITLGSTSSVSVTVTPSGGGTPTGPVTVSDGTGSTCPIALSGGSGSCDLTPSTAGTKSVTAQYTGDANFLGSTSAATTLIVTPPARTVTSSAGSNGGITPASQYVTDGNTASFNVTPNSSYTAVIGGDCPAGSLSHGVYTTGPISSDCAVTAAFVSAADSMSLQVTDDHVYARYGSSIDYVVTASNVIGVDVTGLKISAAASANLNANSSQWMCFGSSTQCQQQGQGAFIDNAVTVPGKGSVSWIVTVPLLEAGPGTMVDYTISLDGPSFVAPLTQTDSDVPVVFHDSFDVPYGDGAQ